MKEATLRALKPGDTVRHRIDGDAYLITGREGATSIAVRTMGLTNPDEWDLIDPATGAPVDQTRHGLAIGDWLIRKSDGYTFTVVEAPPASSFLYADSDGRGEGYTTIYGNWRDHYDRIEKPAAVTAPAPVAVLPEREAHFFGSATDLKDWVRRFCEAHPDQQCPLVFDMHESPERLRATELDLAVVHWRPDTGWQQAIAIATRGLGAEIREEIEPPKERDWSEVKSLTDLTAAEWAKVIAGYDDPVDPLVRPHLPSYAINLLKNLAAYRSPQEAEAIRQHLVTDPSKVDLVSLRTDHRFNLRGIVIGRPVRAGEAVEVRSGSDIKPPQGYLYQFTSAEADAIRDAIDIAYVDGDAPIYEVEGGEALVRRLRQIFGMPASWAPTGRTFDGPHEAPATGVARSAEPINEAGAVWRWRVDVGTAGAPLQEGEAILPTGGPLTDAERRSYAMGNLAVVHDALRYDDNGELANSSLVRQLELAIFMLRPIGDEPGKLRADGTRTPERRKTPQEMMEAMSGRPRWESATDPRPRPDHVDGDAAKA